MLHRLVARSCLTAHVAALNRDIARTDSGSRLAEIRILENIRQAPGWIHSTRHRGIDRASAAVSRDSPLLIRLGIRLGAEQPALLRCGHALKTSRINLHRLGDLLTALVQETDVREGE